jgi:AcrR family transcriptional regulator
MARDSDRKAALIHRLADHVLVHGMAAASLRPLAAAVGTSDRMLLYYFPDKAALIADVLGEIAARMTAILNANRAPEPLPPAALQTHLMPMLFDDAVSPFMQIWLEIAAQAARGDATCQRVGGDIARGFVAWLTDQIDDPNVAARTDEAVRLLMAIEGAVLLNSLGLGDDVQRAMTAPH